MKPYVSVIVPAYNEAAHIRACLETLTAQTAVKDFEIIVVDNASTDGTYKIARSVPGIRVIREARKGVCAARQAGLAAARGDVIVSTDADCTFPPGWLEHIVRRFQNQPDLALLIGNYRFSSVTIPNRLLAAWEQLALRLHYAFGWQWYVSAANLAFRKDRFDGYDPDFGSGGDELYVVSAVRRRGRIGFDTSNPVTTSPRRVRNRFWSSFFKDFGTHYILAYLLRRRFHTNLSHPPDIRTGHLERHDTRSPHTRMNAVLFIFLVIAGVSGAVWILTQIPISLTAGIPTLLGSFALLSGGLAYCLFWPSSQLLMPAAYRVRTMEKLVALTFDDGPNDPYTSTIADIIESYGGRASFFQCGQLIERTPETTERLLRAGHTVGNHTYDHSMRALWRPKRLMKDISRTSQLIEQAGGKPVRFFRSPWLLRTPFVSRAVARCGLIPVSGRFISFREIRQPDGQKMARKLSRKVTPGAIIIMHDSRETRRGNRTETVNAVRELCRILNRDGYRLVSLDQLL